MKTKEVGYKLRRRSRVVYLCFVKLPPSLRVGTSWTAAAGEARPLNLQIGKYKHGLFK